MNIIGISGRISKDFEVMQTSKGTSVCYLSVAVKRPHTKDTTDFFNVNVYRQGAEFLRQYCAKGDLIEVNGHLESYNYEDKNGVSKTRVVISADNVSLQRKAKENERASQQQTTTFTPPETSPAPPTEPAMTAYDTSDFEEILNDDGVPF